MQVIESKPVTSDDSKSEVVNQVEQIVKDYQPVVRSEEEYKAAWWKEIAKWKEIVKKSGTPNKPRYYDHITITPFNPNYKPDYPHYGGNGFGVGYRHTDLRGEYSGWLKKHFTASSIMSVSL